MPKGRLLTARVAAMLTKPPSTDVTEHPFSGDEQHGACDVASQSAQRASHRELVRRCATSRLTRLNRPIVDSSVEHGSLDAIQERELAEGGAFIRR